MIIWTIGHSTHPIDEFIDILGAYEIHQLVDVRTVPGSRFNPQFAKEALDESIPAAGIAYVHMPKLGGLRKKSKDSVNTGWRNLSFRNYADYMQTEDFVSALEELIGVAKRKRTAIMCAEAVPWRCHRSLIADALLVRGVEVVDIMTQTSSQPHKITPFARVDGLSITYPGAPERTNEAG